MTIIAVATTKGGSGKTTLAICLAAYLKGLGFSVECLDTDPNRNLIAWLSNTDLDIAYSTVAGDDIVDAADDASKRSDYVIIDVAGSLDAALIYAVGTADVVIIPARPDGKDVAEASRTRNCVLAAIKTARKFDREATIPHAAVLTQVNPRAQVTPHSREQLIGLGVPVFTSEIPSRTAYQQASYRGFPLSDAKVKDDIKSLVDEIMGLLDR